MAAFSRADFLLTPTAGGKPIAIYTDGWEYHRGRLATDAEQRMALQRSGRYLFWALSWDDVVEKPPTAQAPLEPNGLAVGVHARLRHQARDLHRALVAPVPARQPTAPPPLMPRQAQLASSLQLLMAYLANPSEALWQGMAQQFCLAQAQPLPRSSPRRSAPPCRSTLQLDPHVQEWQGNRARSARGPAPGHRSWPADPQPGGSWVCMSAAILPPASAPSTSSPDPPPLSSSSRPAWREWLRQGNLFQFLPHLLLSTPGWGGSEQTAAVDPPQVWVTADPAKAAPGGSAAPESAAAGRQRAWQELGRFAPAGVQPLLEALEAAWQDTDAPCLSGL